jgi:hypothetical protein
MVAFNHGDRVFYMYAIDNLGEEMQITKEIELKRLGSIL